MKRFYAKAEALASDRGWTVMLDGKPVRTPGRAALDLPTAALAEAVAAEWAAQGDTLRPETMPLTGFAYAAIDRVAPDRSGVRRRPRRLRRDRTAVLPRRRPGGAGRRAGGVGPAARLGTTAL